MYRIAATLLAAVLAASACADDTDTTSAAPASPSATPTVTASPPVVTENPVLDWAAIVVPAIHSAAEPRAPGGAFLLAALAQLAVYDTVMAIDGGYEPYLTESQAPSGADRRAAVAAAARTALRARIAPSRVPVLDEAYDRYLASIPDGPAKRDGIDAGERIARALLEHRSADGFGTTVVYECSAEPLPAGEFEPDGGCGTQPVDAALARAKPFTFTDPARFRPPAPVSTESSTWTRDLDEVREYGAKNSTSRTAEQTDLAYFWSEHAYVFWQRNLTGLARDRELDVADTARLLAFALTAAADAAVAGLDAKYHYRAWRPRTAIPAEAGWEPLLSVNHPEYPSGHGFVSGALTAAVAEHFGTDRLDWTLTGNAQSVPQLVNTARHYADADSLMAAVADARIWSGLHYRYSMTAGTDLGRRVAEHVTGSYFAPATGATPG